MSSLQLPDVHAGICGGCEVQLGHEVGGKAVHDQLTGGHALHTSSTLMWLAGKLLDRRHVKLLPGLQNRIRIHIILGSRIRIRLKKEPWRAVDSHNGSVEAQNGAVEGLCTSGGRISSL